MSTLTILPGNEAHEAPNQKKEKVAKAGSAYSATKLKEKQKAELKQGFTEAILISRGEMDGIPLSELWDE